MKKIYLLVLFITILSWAQAQSTTITPGTVLPQMTTAQRTTLASPTSGMLVFDTGTQSYWYRQNSTWMELHTGSNPYNHWQLSGLGGNEIKNNNSGGFWSSNPVGLSMAVDNNINPPTAPTAEAGTRLMWIPSRSAFRVGTVTDATKWSAANIGLFSFASGFNTMASSYYSTAMGLSTTASGGYSTAAGWNTTANGNGSTAMGVSTIASGEYSTAMGVYTTASGVGSIAIGISAIAQGEFATAMGKDVSTDIFKGSFIIGDSDPTGQGVTYNTLPNQFFARFYNGYHLMTSGNTNPTGVFITGGQTAWSSISDSTRKEKIVIADGESFLLKLRNLRLGSWNYKKHGPNPERFYGPMAQEVFAAFGKDNYGVIGTDTTVSTLNMEGLLFIFSQALEKRTQGLLGENKELKRILEKTELRLEAENQELKAIIQKQDTRLANLEASLSNKVLPHASESKE